MGKIKKWSARKERNPLEVGSKFGRLTVTAPSLPTTQDNSYRYYECTCECGKVIFPRKDTLTNGDSTSCGCFAAEKAAVRLTTHGLSNNPLYDVWYGMVRRCSDPARKDYKHYGGRGIRVLEPWQGDAGLNKFIEDMEATYEPGLEIERIDVNGHYCKENCCWETRRKQVINRRPTGSAFDTHYLTFEGETLCMSEWADKLGMPSTMISDRITTLGWTTEKALTTIPKIRDSMLEIDGKQFSPKDVFVSYANVYPVAKKLGITGHELIYLLFKDVAKLRIFLCKTWQDFKPRKGLESTDLSTITVPKVKEEFKSLGLRYE